MVTTVIWGSLHSVHLIHTWRKKVVSLIVLCPFVLMWLIQSLRFLKASAGARTKHVFPSKERLSHGSLSRNIPWHTHHWRVTVHLFFLAFFPAIQETQLCSLLELFQIYTGAGIKYMQNGLIIPKLIVTLTKCQVSKCCILSLGVLSPPPIIQNTLSPCLLLS